MVAQRAAQGAMTIEALNVSGLVSRLPELALTRQPLITAMVDTDQE